MQAPFEMIEGRKRLKQILSEFPPDSCHWNEAQNRFHFVDRLLYHCLGWEHPNIEVEPWDEDGGKADYVLGKPPIAVLEAKRQAKHFRLLPASAPSAPRRLQPQMENCPTFAAAARQVASYCFFHGAQTAIICNGPQLVVFQALVGNAAPLKGECYIFNGFNSYLQNFPLLWSFLSPEGVYENRAYRELEIRRNPRIPAKALTAIPDPTRFRYRNDLQQNLQTLSSLLLEDILDDPAVKKEFYDECWPQIDICY